ncbi:MAG: UDP-N-acetylglucosamine 2-epimerase (non-hydrolyzing) [Clostridiales bacterium]|nr:UDP-N-acetylglucosamine 2-epimerase (non-hydrolyzing) [Clostridiales bacterium]
MEKLKVMSVFGTRPEAIKMVPLIKELSKNENIESTVCVTAQHRQMLDQVLNIFEIKPDYDLDIMKQSQTLTYITSAVITEMAGVFKLAKPDLCLVHGDTTTTFATSLAAFYSGVRVGHVEAGLRTNDKYQPYPEEMNRRLTANLADLHFAPTSVSKGNLLRENIPGENIFITGNTAIDIIKDTVKKDYVFGLPLLNRLDFGKKIITMTAHRGENIGEGIANICRAVLRIVQENTDVELVYAVHLNPAVRRTVFEILKDKPRIHLIDPLDIMDMHNLMSRSYFIYTDSGGLQEEAPSMDKPVLVLRNVTERPEGLAAGTLLLAGVKEDEIYKSASLLLTDKKLYEKMANAKNPFGDGMASSRITQAILFSYEKAERPADYVV